MPPLTLVQPAPGLSIFDPVRRDFVPDEGREVDLTDFYWLRLLRDGDIVAVAAESPAHEHSQGSEQ